MRAGLCRDFDALHPRHIETERRLEACISADGLPLKIWETFRSPLRQRNLFERGRSLDPSTGKWRVVDQGKVVTGTPVWSPHIYGLAVDRVLIVGHPFWVDEQPLHPWDTGVERDKEGRQHIVRHQVFQVWARFGRMANSAGVKWGGQFQREGRDGRLIGWDPFHTEHREWRRIAVSLRSDPSWHGSFPSKP